MASVKELLVKVFGTEAPEFDPGQDWEWSDRRTAHRLEDAVRLAEAEVELLPDEGGQLVARLTVGQGRDAVELADQLREVFDHVLQPSEVEQAVVAEGQAVTVRLPLL